MLTRKETKELSRLRLVPRAKRTTEQFRRLLVLMRKHKPFDAMPKESK